jgi:hypothetical protein
MKITLLYKGKGKHNWIGICLKEVVAKLLSAIIANILLIVLDAAYVSEQFATIGCQEAIHTLRAATVLRIMHGQETFVLFVYLVKAYDTINHELLFRILDKYGIPSELIDAIKRMYASCEIQITTGNEKRLIDYLTSGQQGGNVAPVLLLFFMLAVSQTLKKKWNFKFPKYGYFEEKKCGKSGRIKNQNYKTQGTYLYLFHLLYI